MKRFNLVPLACLTALAATASCSQEGLDNVNTSGKGSGASSGSGMTQLGGTGGSTGGTGTGGSMGGSMGGTGTGGSAGSGNASNGGSGPAGMGGTGNTGMLGGSAGTVAMMGGSAGTVTMMGGSAGTVTMMGGSAGLSAGGMPGGGMAGSGMAGMGMAGGGSGGLDPKDIVPDLHGFYWEGTCSGDPSVTQATGHNCPMTGTLTTAPANGVNSEKAIMVKGTTGQAYTINIEVRGVIGTRCYTGGTRASSAGLSEDGNNNWWYVGGSYANPTGWWNTYELKVTPSTGDASGDIYYFNGSGVQGGNDCEREATYLVKYNASFKAKGGGTLTFKIHDQNGKGQQNCGKETDPNSTCAPRMVDLTGMAASPPANFKQPPANALEKTYYPQWMLIAVTSITSP
jgi:hypothetical protein